MRGGTVREHHCQLSSFVCYLPNVLRRQVELVMTKMSISGIIFTTKLWIAETLSDIIFKNRSTTNDRNMVSTKRVRLRTII